jgi:hypothetical protein
VASGSQNGMDQTVFDNNNPTYEILSPQGKSSGNNIYLAILGNNQPYFMYPFIHLLKDGNLFIFVNTASQIYDPMKMSVVSQMPGLQGIHTFGLLAIYKTDILRHATDISEYWWQRHVASSCRRGLEV